MNSYTNVVRYKQTLSGTESAVSIVGVVGRNVRQVLEYPIAKHEERHESNVGFSPSTSVFYILLKIGTIK